MAEAEKKSDEMSKAEKEPNKISWTLRRLVKSGVISTHSNQSETHSGRDELPKADVQNDALKPEYQKKTDEEALHRGYGDMYSRSHRQKEPGYSNSYPPSHDQKDMN